MRTTMAKTNEVEQGWYLVDAKDRVVGRLATRIARILMGKHRPVYTPHVDTGEHVVVINAAHVRFTGRKMDQQTYYHYTGYPGGLRARKVRDVLKDKPEDVLFLAIRRMMPKTKMGRRMIGKLRIHPGAEHPHEAQQPQPLEL